jgi:hypothetical protein
VGRKEPTPKSPKKPKENPSDPPPDALILVDAQRRRRRRRLPPRHDASIQTMQIAPSRARGGSSSCGPARPAAQTSTTAPLEVEVGKGGRGEAREIESVPRKDQAQDTALLKGTAFTAPLNMEQWGSWGAAGGRGGGSDDHDDVARGPCPRQGRGVLLTTAPEPPSTRPMSAIAPEPIFEIEPNCRGKGGGTVQFGRSSFGTPTEV